MAIKGKKKSQQRGSQARRRPAMAPRPVTGRAQKVPWYKTTKGQTIAAVSALVLIVVLLAVVSNNRKEAEEQKQAQETLENYTDQIKALQQRLSQPATEMAAIANTPSDDLAADAEEWNAAFTGAQSTTAQFFAPEGATASSQLFTQSVNLLKAAAETLTVAADLEGQDQEALISAVSTQVQSASGVWDAGVTVLDQARDDLELSASGIATPVSVSQPSVQQTPGASATVPVTPPGGGGGGKAGGGKGKKGDDS